MKVIGTVTHHLNILEDNMKKTLILATMMIALSLFTYNTIKWLLWDNETIYAKEVYTDISKDEVDKIEKLSKIYDFDSENKKYMRVDKIRYSIVRTKFLCYEEIEKSKECIHRIIQRPD